MNFKVVIKGILPYKIIINYRNKKHHFKQLLISSNNDDIKKEEPNYQGIISVQGFGYSGSGAVLDLLREYDNTLVLGFMDPEATINNKKSSLSEIEIIRLPGGLFEIENNLLVDNVFLNDALLNRTIKLFESSALFEYSPEIKGLFVSFFKNITSLRLTGLSRTYYNGYLANPDEESGIYFLKKMSSEFYLELCKDFLRGIFNNINNGSKYIVADQLFSDTDLNIERNSKYVDNLKSIIVVRDPRDIYAWSIMRNIEWIAHNTVEEYIQWYKLQYKNVDNLKGNDNCIIISYENLIIEYESEVSRLENYLGYTKESHDKCKEFFNPEYSRKFVGIYKDICNDIDLSKIKEELSDYCNSLIE